MNTEKLNQLFRAKGCTQAQMAVALDTRQTTVSQWLNGKSEPHRRTLAAIAAFFGVPVSELTSEDSSGLAAKGTHIVSTPSASPSVLSMREQVELLRLKLEAAKLRQQIIDAGGDPDAEPLPAIPPAPTGLPPGVSRAGFAARKDKPEPKQDGHPKRKTR